MQQFVGFLISNHLNISDNINYENNFIKNDSINLV